MAGTPSSPTALSVVRLGSVILIMWLFQYLDTYTGAIRQTSIDPCLDRAEPWLFDVEPTAWLFEYSTPRREDWFVDILLCHRWPELAHGS